jgi:hypothetical protein
MRRALVVILPLVAIAVAHRLHDRVVHAAVQGLVVDDVGLQAGDVFPEFGAFQRESLLGRPGHFR